MSDSSKMANNHSAIKDNSINANTRKLLQTLCLNSPRFREVQDPRSKLNSRHKIKKEKYIYACIVQNHKIMQFTIL